MSRGVTDGRGGGPGRRLLRQETSRFLRAEDESRLRTNLEARRTRTEVDDMDAFDDAASDRDSVRNIVTHIEGRGQQQGQQQRTGRQDNAQVTGPEVGGGQGQQQQRQEGGAGQWQGNEFDVGRRLMEIGDRLRSGIRDIVARLRDREMSVEEVRATTADGLMTLMTAVDGLMNGMSDTVQADRQRQERVAKETSDRIVRMEEKAKDTEVRVEAASNARERQRRKESVAAMKEKIRQAERQIKILDIDFARPLSNRREIVERTIGYMKEDVILSDRKRFDILINRTRLVVLGKETRQVMYKGEWIHTVPVLLECRNEGDKMELEDILRNCQWFNTFHWPVECMPFVKEVRNEVRRMGYEDESHYVRIRPEMRDGMLQVRGDVKEKGEGGKFRPVAVWDVPPMDKSMWGRDVARPRVTLGRRALNG